MWCKFLSAFGESCQTTSKVTALNFQKTRRKDWSEQEHDDELRDYFEKIQDPAFLRKIDKLSFFSRLKKKSKKLLARFPLLYRGMKFIKQKCRL
jgi:hypothetical protein